MLRVLALGSARAGCSPSRSADPCRRLLSLNDWRHLVCGCGDRSGLGRVCKRIASATARGSPPQSRRGEAAGEHPRPRHDAAYGGLIRRAATRSRRSGGAAHLFLPQDLAPRVSNHSRLPTPNSQLPTPNSQLPTPNSRLPTPEDSVGLGTPEPRRFRISNINPTRHDGEELIEISDESAGRFGQTLKRFLPERSSPTGSSFRAITGLRPSTKEAPRRRRDQRQRGSAALVRPPSSLAVQPAPDGQVGLHPDRDR